MLPLTIPLFYTIFTLHAKPTITPNESRDSIPFVNSIVQHIKSKNSWQQG